MAEKMLTVNDYSEWELITDRWVNDNLGYIYSDFINMVYPRLRKWVNEHPTIKDLPDFTWIRHPHKNMTLSFETTRVRALPVNHAKRMRSLLRVWHKTLGIAK